MQPIKVRNREIFGNLPDGMRAILQKAQQQLAAEGMRLAVAEVRERHLAAAAHPRIHVMHLAGEAVGRQPFGHGIGVEEGAVDAFSRRTEDAVETDCVGGHGLFSFQCVGMLQDT